MSWLRLTCCKRLFSCTPKQRTPFAELSTLHECLMLWKFCSELATGILDKTYDTGVLRSQYGE